MKSVNGVLIESIKLTLHEKLDSDVIEVLNAMPYRSKSRWIVAALRAMYRANGDGELVIVNEDAEQPAPQPAPQPPSQPTTYPKATKTQTAKAGKGGKGITIEEF